MAYHPVSKWEREAASLRPGGCTIAVREDFTPQGGQPFPLLSYGSPEAWEYVMHEGKVYGVFRREPADKRVFA